MRAVMDYERSLINNQVENSIAHAGVPSMNRAKLPKSSPNPPRQFL